MPRGHYSTEEIIGKLREAEVLLSQGQAVGQVARSLGISEQTYFRRRKEYGGLRSDQAQRLKALEQENSRLNRLAGLPLSGGGKEWWNSNTLHQRLFIRH